MARRAPRVKCQGPGCNRVFSATRTDTKYCSERCRYNARMENAKFLIPAIPQSPVPGVTFNRVRQRWEVRIREDNRQKYVGSFGDMAVAEKFHAEVVGA